MISTAHRKSGPFLLTIFVVTLGWPFSACPDEFTYQPPGQLVEGSGQGREDFTVYVPGMRFPIEEAPAYANSQVWGHGGMNGPGGGQCHEENYSYPWWDNYCETRSWDVPMCPTGNGHQGQDIRPRTCQDDLYWAVAAEDGAITNIGSYSVYLQGDSGTLHRYLHMSPSSVTVSVGDRVTRGQRLGRVSNAFGGTPTTIHLHYDINQYVAGHGNTYVSPYMSLVRSYEELLGVEPRSCEQLPREGGVIDNESPCFRLHGTMSSWRSVTDAGLDGSLYWTHAWERERDNWAEWRIDLESRGEYRVRVYVVPEYAQSQEARYVVRHGGAETEVRLDQSSGDRWLLLGEFEFTAGGDQFVSVNDDTGELLEWHRRLMADAVELERVTEPVDESVVDESIAEPEPLPETTPEMIEQDTGSIQDTTTDSPGPDEAGEVATESTTEDIAANEAHERSSSTEVNSGCGCHTHPSSLDWLNALMLLTAVLVLRGRRGRSGEKNDQLIG